MEYIFIFYVLLRLVISFLMFSHSFKTEFLAYKINLLTPYEFKPQFGEHESLYTERPQQLTNTAMEVHANTYT